VRVCEYQTSRSLYVFEQNTSVFKRNTCLPVDRELNEAAMQTESAIAKTSTSTLTSHALLSPSSAPVLAAVQTAFAADADEDGVNSERSGGRSSSSGGGARNRRLHGGGDAVHGWRDGGGDDDVDDDNTDGLVWLLVAVATSSSSLRLVDDERRPGLAQQSIVDMFSSMKF